MAAPPVDGGLSPQAFLQLAGHPLRWQLLRDLARSDRTVHELTGLAGQSQNLVSYHLGKLRDAGLVSARRSSADRRDSYYRVDLTRVGEMLSATGGALHPALRLTPPGPPSPARPPGRAERRAPGAARVLFLCTGNSARSQMAEALTRARSGGLVDARSAGSAPKPLHPHAVRVMRDEHGIDLSGHRSKHLSVFTDQRFDRVVTLCDRVREVCPDFPGHPETTHWSIADPAGHADSGNGSAGYQAFRQTAAEVEMRVGHLLAALTAPATAARTPAQERP